MICFNEASPVFQYLLLMVNQLTVTALTGGCILVIRRRDHIWKQITMVLLLLINCGAHLVLFVNARGKGIGEMVHYHVPFSLLVLIAAGTWSYGLWVVLRATRYRKSINANSIKEAVDNLPTGVCFFNEAGMPVLCNRAMNRFSFAVRGKDVQFVTELTQCLEDGFVPKENIRKTGNVFQFSDGSSWQLEQRMVEYEDGSRYTQFTATDITMLHNRRLELQEENAQLQKVSMELKQLSANVVAATHEEEVLNAKMRVHSEMGRCLTAAQRYLQGDTREEIPESVVNAWQRAVSMLKYNNDTPDEDMLLQVRKTCESLHMEFIQRGQLPKAERAAYLLTCAVRECVTNAVRYAMADKLYAVFIETPEEATVVVTNSGKAPEGEIQEGGGLSTLRKRVEKAGGMMVVEYLPQFKLTVTVPKEKEGMV